MTYSLFLLCSLIVTSYGQINRSPKFLPDGDMTNFSIEEDTPIGSSVYTLRGEDPDKSKLTYYISGDNFSVDKVTGVVKLINKLDREKNAKEQVIITVTDESISGTPPNTVSVHREITVLDVNDNAPTFQNQPYSFFIGETAKPGTVVFDRIMVTDADSGFNSEINLSCLQEESKGSCDVFEVIGDKLYNGDVKARIIVKKPLDYEKKSSYRMVIMAEDQGAVSLRLSSKVIVNIRVKDVQDQPPVFQNDPYSVTLPENSQEGTQVLTVTAMDGDKGDPRSISLSVHKDSKGYFTLGDTKEIYPGVYSAPLMTSSVPINREDRDILNNGGLYIFQVKAAEVVNGAPSGDQTVANVSVVVSDVDDQSPMFNGKEFHVDVMEGLSSNTPLPGLNIVVWDNDVGENAHFELSLRDIQNSDGVFSVYPESAVGRTPVIIKLSDSSKLDYEKIDSRVMKFEVIASQNSVRASSATVTVNVLDVNDNSPKFSQDQYVVKVEESTSPGSVIVTLTADDADSGSFGELTYSLRGYGAEKFTVDNKTGVIRLAHCNNVKDCIDYEMRSSYSLTYSARDGGGRVATVNLLMDIVDVNDNAPQFIHEQYHRQILENTIQINPPLMIKATDIDGRDQGAGLVTYHIEPSNGTSENSQSSLVIDPNSGQIKLVKPLKYNETGNGNGELTYVVVATDDGSPPKSSRVNLHIKVMKENDGTPIFTNEPYSAHVKENSKPGTSVMQVIATDPDGRDSAITYFISKGARDNFIINSKTGVISIATNGNLDLDMYGDEFNVTVEAVDSGNPMQQTATATVSVHIMDVNNKPPIFAEESYTQYISERLEPGETVLTVVASDQDTNSKLRYTIIEPITARDKTGLILESTKGFNYKNSFRINGTSGEITVNNHLDYKSAAVYIFTVQAVDLNAVDGHEQKAKAEVTIFVQAFDNKHPVFPAPWTSSNPKIEISIAEEQPIDSELMSLSAKDPVTGQDIRKFEEVEGSDEGDFVAISPISGTVFLNRRLDYESLPLKYITFKVNAISDGPGPQRSSESEIKINIQDINDNSPVFSQNSYKARLSESVRYPYSLVTVLATDDDSDERYGDVRYGIIGQGSDLFTIDPVKGTVQVQNGSILDRETKSSYNFQVTAVDNPSSSVNQRKTSVILTVDILDVNDNMPDFTRDTYTAVVPENVPKDISVTKIEASDKDEGDGGKVDYEILQERDAKGLFKISKESGNVYVKGSLAGKGRSDPYKLTIRATDRGKIPLSNEVDLLVFIGDVATNDGVPQFVKPAVGKIASVYENSTIGTSVYQVVAVDPDNPNTDNGKVAFKFLEDTNNRDGVSLFSIDPITGIISTKEYLDRESKQNYTLIIVAYDLGNNPQEATRVLDVVVLDIDDNNPRFDRPLNADPIRMNVKEEGPVGAIIGIVEANDEDEGKNAIIDYYIIDGDQRNLFGIRRNNNNKGEIYTKMRLDKEVESSHLLTIKVAKHGVKFQLPRSFVGYDPHNFDEIRVKIDVEDIDDNQPVFQETSKVFGVRVDAELHSEVVSLVAQDSDDTSGQMMYSVHSITFTERGQTTREDNAFIIDKYTGVLRTNKLYGPFLGGFFTLTVRAMPENSANNTNSSATTNLITHVVKDTELMKFVFRKAPGEVRKAISNFKRNLNEVLATPVTINLYDSQYYSDDDGRLDLQSTSSCFQLIQENKILSPEQSLDILDHNKHPQLLQLYRNYSIVEVQKCANPPDRDEMSWVEIFLIAIGAFVLIIALLASVILCCMYCSYKRKLKKASYYNSIIASRPGTPAYMFE